MRKLASSLSTKCLATLALFSSASLSAAPWIDTSDIYLRADIQALADAGVITVPVNTYPLMWSGIGVDLAKVEPSTLPSALVEAYARVNFNYRNAVDNRGNGSIKLAAASEAARFQHFGSDYREQGEARGSYEYLGDRFAYKVSASGNYDPSDEKEFRFDDSYLAMVVGNWMVTLGAVSQWWGPGFDSALHKSNNARPMPSLMLSRNKAEAFETPWLSWIGPWSFTAGISKMEAERAVPNALLWNLRGSIRPFRQLELGVSWTTQFCGDGQECSFASAFKSITGQKDCRNEGAGGCTTYGNQVAGYDIRFSDTWYDVPFGLYYERTCEDSTGSLPWDIVDCGSLFGADTRFNFVQQQYKLFFEYSNTMVFCGTDETAFNCFYEHSVYKSGSRYYGRSLGSTYDSDANVYVLGLIGQYENSKGFTSLLRYAQLNKDGAKPSHWAPQLIKEDLLMLELSYRMPLWRGMMSVGGTVAQAQFDTKSNETDGTIFGTYEYRF